MPRRADLEQRIDALSRYWDVYRPKGEGPFPLVVQLHGCGGKKPFQATWANVATDSGVAALVIDSHRPRNISQLGAYTRVCTGAILRGGERAGDLVAALEWARRQDWVDKDRLYAAGWSHGGWTILDAMCLGNRLERVTGLSNAPGEPFAGLRGAFIVYPYAGPGMLARSRPLTAKPDISAIVCGRDMIVGMDGPMRMLRGLEAQGAKTRIELFRDGTHAFDEPDAHDMRVRYDPALTKRAHQAYREFLASAFS